jgi:hypothetical protein
VNWFTDWLEQGDPKTFEQDLELLIARWTDRSRKGDKVMTLPEIVASLEFKAKQLTQTRSQGA